MQLHSVAILGVLMVMESLAVSSCPFQCINRFIHSCWHILPHSLYGEPGILSLLIRLWKLSWIIFLKLTVSLYLPYGLTEFLYLRTHSSIPTWSSRC